MTDSGCQQCGENSFSAAGASSCTSCAEGKISDAGSTSEDDCECEYGMFFSISMAVIRTRIYFETKIS